MRIKQQLLLLVLGTAVCLIGASVSSAKSVVQVGYRDQDRATQTAMAEVDITQKIVELSQVGMEQETAGKYSAARIAYEEILSLLESADSETINNIQRQETVDVESALESLMLIYWSEQRPERAVDVVGRAIQLQAAHENLFRSSFSPEEQESLAISYSEEKTGALIARSVLATADSSVVRQAFSTVMVRKGRVLDAIAAVSQAQRSAVDLSTQDELNTLYRSLANLTLDSNRKQAQGERVQAEVDEITVLQDKITAININLMRESARGLEWLYIPPSGSDSITTSVIESMPANAAFVEIVEYSAADGERRYAAFVVTKGGDIEAVDLGSAAKINEQSIAFRNVIEARSVSVKAIGQELYAQIIDPIQPHLEAQTHLLISPDSYLNTIPFEALVNASDQYLVETYQISYLLSGKDIIKFSDDMDERRSRRYRSPFTLIANPDYNLSAEGDYSAIATAATNRRSVDFGSPTFTNLPGTAQEASSIESALPNVISLTQNEPTESIIKQIHSPVILHFATHGFFLSDGLAIAGGSEGRSASLDVISTGESGLSDSDRAENPLLRAGLVLTGANNPGESGEDGILTALEVSELNLQGTELVVLSACETGLGDVSSGEGVYGMRRAFAMAGATSQIMSLWQVDDAGTSELMSLFYQNLMQDDQGRSEALRNAQFSLLNTGTYQHPYYWSSFILSGDWRSFYNPAAEEMPTQAEIDADLATYVGVTTENFQLSAQIAEYRRTRAWRDDMLAKMLELGDQRRYEELEQMRAEFYSVMNARTHPDLFKVSDSLLHNLNFRMEDLYKQQRYEAAIEVAETMVEIQQSGTEERDRFDASFNVMRSLHALAFLHQANGDDVSAVLAHKRAATYENSL